MGLVLMGPKPIPPCGRPGLRPLRRPPIAHVVIAGRSEQSSGNELAAQARRCLGAVAQREAVQLALLTVKSPVMPFWACPGTGHR